MIKTRKNLAAFAFMLAMLFIFSSLTYAQDKVNIEDENLSGVENEQVYNFSLNDAIEYALENNKQLEINDSIIKAAEIKVQEEKANQRKALNVKFTVPYASTTMAFEILTKRGYYVELAEYQLEVAKKTKERDIKALQATVQNNYYNLKTSVKKYNIAQSIEKHALENLKAVELKYKLGLASEIELLGAKTAAKKATADKNASERSVNLSRMTFNRSIGLPVFIKVNLTDDIKIEKYKVDLNEKVELALENRLEMYNAKRVYELDKLYIEAMGLYNKEHLCVPLL